MTRFDETFKQEVRDKTDIVGLVGEYVRLEKRGNRYVGLCPFHQEKTPSFSVRPDEQFYYCFGCKATGDVFHFVMEKEHLTFPEALELLARRAKIPLPREERTPAQEAVARERSSIYDALEFATRFFTHQLLETERGKEPLAYLAGRGLKSDTISRFRLGYAPDSWEALGRASRSRGIAPATLVKAGLVRSREEGDGHYDLFRRRIMFPIRDLRGRVVGFGGRAVAPDQNPKYYNSPEGPYFSKRMHLYGLDLAKESMRAGDMGVIVEGYMDAIALHQAGFPMAVASLGTALTDQQAHLLRQQCARAVIAYDADLAGQAATQRGLDLLVRAGCDVRVVQLPQGKDPDELVRTLGPEAFRQALDQAVPLTEFKLQQALAQHADAGNTAESKAKAVRDVLPLLAQLSDLAVRQDEYIKKVAGQLQVAEESLRIDVKRYLDNLRKAAPPQYRGSRNWNNTKVLGSLPEEQAAGDSAATPEGEVAGGTVPAARPRRPGLQAKTERVVLRLLLHYPRLHDRATGALASYRWAGDDHGALYQALTQAAAGGSGEMASRVMTALADPGARSLVAELTDESRHIMQPEQELAEALRTLGRLADERRMQELRQIIQEREAAGQATDPALVIEFQELIRRTRN